MPGTRIRRGAVGAFAGVLLLLFAAGSATSASAKTRWRASVAKLPANALAADSVYIGSISCASPGNCAAVGWYDVSPGDQEGLLLTEKAGHWAAGVEAVLPANAASEPWVSLTSVSCASPGNCTAVGSYYDGNSSTPEGLLLTEKAGHWAPGVEATLPADAGTPDFVSLSSVSCASPGNCTAVGYGDTDHTQGHAALLLTEQAGDWARGVLVGSEARLISVSCASDGSCSAVGYDHGDFESRNSVTGVPLLLTKSSGEWRRVEAVMPPDGPGEAVLLTSVSCASGGNCGATGLYNISIDRAAGPEGVLLTEKAGTWKRGVTAVPPKRASKPYWGAMSVDRISCATAGNCLAIGDYHDVGGRDLLTLLTEKAGKWLRGIEPALPPHAKRQGASLSAVSCASPGSCTVVGGYLAGGGFVAHGLLLTELHGGWGQGVKAPLAAYVSSVSCASPGNCGAVGSDPHGRGVLLDSTTARG